MQIHPVELLQAVENVDAALLDKVRAALSPQGTCAVAASANFTFIVCSLMRGETPLEVSKLLEKERHEVIPGSVIRDYALKYIPPEIVRPNLLFKYLAKADEPINEVQVLEACVRIQQARVAAIVDKQDLGLRSCESSRRELELLKKMAESSLDAKIRTGQVPGAKGTGDGVGVVPQAPSQHLHLHIEGVSKTVDTREAANALRAVRDIKALLGGVVVPERREDGSEN